MKLTPKPCPYCGADFMPRAIQQLNCDKVGCQIKARERQASMERERRRQREYRERQIDRHGRVRGGEVELAIRVKPGFRPCLKCDRPIPRGQYFCPECKRINQRIMAEDYQGVW